jgi:indole-3-glycerol phosphate synthase
VIAECKRRSPSRGILREDYRPAQHAKAYAEAGAAAISVLTEPTFFDGSLADLQAVSVAVEIPLLRKDFIVDRYQILEAVASGADAVLLIVGALEPASLRALLAFAAEANVAALVEVHGAAELRIAADAGAALIGVNSRNLRTLDVEPHVHDRLAPLMPKGVVTVAESGLREHADSAAPRARRVRRVPGRRAADRAAGSRALGAEALQAAGLAGRAPAVRASG